MCIYIDSCVYTYFNTFVCKFTNSNKTLCALSRKNNTWSSESELVLFPMAEPAIVAVWTKLELPLYIYTHVYYVYIYMYSYVSCVYVYRYVYIYICIDIQASRFPNWWNGLRQHTYIILFPKHFIYISHALVPRMTPRNILLISKSS